MILALLLLAAPPPHPTGGASCTVTCSGEIVEAVDTRKLAKTTIRNGVIQDDAHQIHVMRSMVVEHGQRYELITYVYE